jgi:hypothetical protein
MRKFVVHTRSLPGVCKTNDLPIVLEVEGEIITGMEDPSVLFLPKGEFMFRILKPESLYESKEIIHADKSREKIAIPPIYYSHAIHWTEHGAMAEAIHIVRGELEFQVRKGKRDSFTEQDVQEQANLIQIVRLPKLDI